MIHLNSWNSFQIFIGQFSQYIFSAIFCCKAMRKHFCCSDLLKNWLNLPFQKILVSCRRIIYSSILFRIYRQLKKKRYLPPQLNNNLIFASMLCLQLIRQMEVNLNFPGNLKKNWRWPQLIWQMEDNLDFLIAERLYIWSCLSVRPSVCLSVCLSVRLSVCPFVPNSPPRFLN